MLHGQTRYNIASRFFEEIPDSLMKRINSRPASHARDYRVTNSGAYAPLVARDPGPGIPWRIGQSVSHAKFGTGVIVSAEGRGADARVQVNFRDQGLKWLALEYAKLTAA